jgi:hypothetical protein
MSRRSTSYSIGFPSASITTLPSLRRYFFSLACVRSIVLPITYASDAPSSDAVVWAGVIIEARTRWR